VTDRYSFGTKEEFVEKLRELVESGVPRGRINTHTPYHVHEAEELLDHGQSHVRFFTGAGAVTGCAAGFTFTIYTVKSWPLITGGKEIVSIPAFIIIAYELMILFGGLTAFAGFLFLTRLPALRSIVSDKSEFSRRFEITVAHKDRS
jgi:hypothetical protein